MKLEFKWEDICVVENFGTQHATSRVKVPKGWIINHSVSTPKGLSNSMVFVFDENHVWKIIKQNGGK